MKPKASSSRNVKAQRKFAQGAYIPPSNQTVEQRRDVGHKQLNTKPVLNTQINMSAASLLDHVTFKNLYPHFQPIVLLERLDCSRLDCSRLHCSRLHCSRLDCSRLHCSRLHCSRLHCSSLENVRRKKRRSWSVSGDVRVGETRVLNEKHNNNKPDKQQRMTRSKSQCNTTIRSRSSIRVPGDGKERLKKHVTFRDDFSIDDNRPLTFFTSNATMKTRGSHVDSEAEPTKAKLPRTSSNEEKPDSVSEKLGQHSARRSRDRYKRDRINKAHTTTTVERDKDNSCRKRDKNNQDKETPNKNMSNNNSTTHESSIQPFAAPNKTQNFDEQQESLTRLNKMIAEVMEKVHRTQGDDIEMVEILSEQEEMIIDQVTPQQDAFEKLTTKINSSANNNKNRIIEEKTISTDTSKTLHMSKDNAMTPSKLKAKQKIARGNIVPDSGPRSSRKKTIESGNVVKTLRKSRRLNAIEKTLVKSVQTRRKSLSQASSLQNCTVARRKSISNPSLPDKYQSQTSTLSAIHLSKPSTSQNSTGLGQLSTQDNKDVENDQHDSDSSGQICGRLRWSTSSERTVIENKESETDYNNTKEVTGMRNHFPKRGEKAEIVNGLIFYPTKTEFADLLSYFQKIQPEAQNYGICKIVPPENFNPTCHMKDGMRFSVSNEYVSRLYKRWGWGQREMCAIKVNSATQGVVFNKAPLLDSTEVDLPKLYKSVQNIGGLKKVMDRKLWLRIAEELRVNNCLHPDRKLDCIYVKYVLGYDTLTNEERQHMLEHVESCWHKNNSKMMKRAMNPLHTKKKLLEETDSSEEEEDDVDQIVAAALTETEECVIDGRQMNLKMFKKISENIMYQHFPNVREPDPNDIEEQFWRIVLLAADHVCVNVASVDTGPQGYGFTKNKNDPYGRHAWNLKALCQNPGNILRSLSSVPGVTTPTLHLGMCFSCSCWHRDPHGLPWIEYMHSGPSKIWYGIPDEQSDEFRKAVEVLCPTSYRNKPIWLPSDITMIPPTLLRDNNVSLSRIVQQPGEFIIVFPKAYSCSINTGYTQSESAYFATSSWLKNVLQIFQELRESCEPSAFSLEQLLVSVARDQRVSFTVLQQVQESLTTVIFEELSYRQTLMEKGVKVIYGEISTRTRRRRGWNSRNDECDICRSILYLSKVVGIITKKSQVCLQHAIKLLNVRGNRVNVFQVEMILPFLDEELEDIVAGVVDRLAKL